ncbi:MAG: response regulator [Bdellovibrionales bacterium]|nr:response regulator [Bdellovibrionales bacterium]
MPTPKLALVVEDDPMIYPLIKAMFNKLNPQTTLEFADSAEKAAELLLGPSAKKYDVILSDLQLAGQKSGVDLVKEVYFKTGRTPFVLTTGKEDYNTHLPFLKKPLRYEDFAERIGPFLTGDAAAPKKSGGKLPLLIAGLVILAAAAYFFASR